MFFALRDALMFGAIVWVLYMAFEPYVRKRSPRTLISWSRLLAGRWRDPLVGADLLAGCVLGTIAVCVVRPLVSPFNASLAPQLMSTPGEWLSAWCMASVFAVGGALTSLFLLALLLLLVRVQWLAALLFIGILALLPALPGAILSGIVFTSLLWCGLTRFGVLSASALLYASNVAELFPSPFSPSAWYVQSSVMAVLSIVAMAAYAFHTTLAGRRLWRENFHEE